MQRTGDVNKGGQLDQTILTQTNQLSEGLNQNLEAARRRRMAAVQAVNDQMAAYALDPNAWKNKNEAANIKFDEYGGAQTNAAWDQAIIADKNNLSHYGTGINSEVVGEEEYNAMNTEQQREYLNQILGNSKHITDAQKAFLQGKSPLPTDAVSKTLKTIGAEQNEQLAKQVELVRMLEEIGKPPEEPDKTDAFYLDAAEKYKIQMGVPENASDAEKVTAAKAYLDSKSKEAVTVTDPNGEFAKLGLIGPDGKLRQGLVTTTKDDGKMSLSMSESSGSGIGGKMGVGENFSMDTGDTHMKYETVMGILRKSNDGTVHDPLQTKAKSLHRLGLVQNMFNRFAPPGQETKNPYMEAYEQRLETIKDVNTVMSERGTTEELLKGSVEMKGGAAKMSAGIEADKSVHIVTNNRLTSKIDTAPRGPDEKDPPTVMIKGGTPQSGFTLKNLGDGWYGPDATRTAGFTDQGIRDIRSSLYQRIDKAKYKKGDFSDMPGYKKASNGSEWFYFSDPELGIENLKMMKSEKGDWQPRVEVGTTKMKYNAAEGIFAGSDNGKSLTLEY